MRRDHKLTRSPFLLPRFASAEPHTPPPNIVKFTIKFIDKEEGSSAADYVTDVTDVTDVSPMSVGRWKKEDGRRKKEEGRWKKEDGIPNKLFRKPYFRFNLVDLLI
ncbi:hypothetical protein [Microcoleus sp.]|uniref:hypothetical protein n=1 Tax=Microcoleus sp. TaxID=44472 RepID=UPI0035945248